MKLTWGKQSLKHKGFVIRGPSWVSTTSQSQIQSSGPPVVLPHRKSFFSLYLGNIFSILISSKLFGNFSKYWKVRIPSPNWVSFQVIYLPIKWITNLRRKVIVKEFMSVKMFFVKSSTIDTWWIERWMKFESIFIIYGIIDWCQIKEDATNITFLAWLAGKIYVNRYASEWPYGENEKWPILTNKLILIYLI